MNDKDLEAFDEWKEAARSEAEEVNRLQAENKKLREALEFYANNQITMTIENGVYLRDGLNGKFFPLKEKAREALKEVENTK